MSTGGLKGKYFFNTKAIKRKNNQDCLDTEETRLTAVGLRLLMILMTKTDELMKGFCF